MTYKSARDNLVLVGFIIVLLACPSIYAFESELVPSEMNSLTLFAKTKTEWSLHKDPDKNAPLMKNLTVSVGETIAFDQSRIRTIKPGRIVVNKSATLNTHNFGNITYLSVKTYDAAFSPGAGLKTYSFKTGDTFEELHHAPEGCCFIQWKSEVFYVDRCPWYSSHSGSFEYVSRPTFEWWVRVIEDNKPLGWFLVDKTISGF